MSEPQPSAERTRVRLRLASGSVFNGLVIIGTGMAILLPEQRWIGGLLVALGFFALVFDVKFERGHIAVGSPETLLDRIAKMGLVRWGLVLLTIFIAGALAFGLRQCVFPPEHARPSSPLDNTISIDCEYHPLPDIVPPSGHMNMVSINANNYKSDPLNVVVTGGRVGTPGERWDWTGLGGTPHAELCRIANLGPSTLLRTYAEFPVSIKADEKLSAGSSKEGRTLISVKAKVLIADLETGGNNAAWVYFYNDSRDAWAEVTVPTTGLVWQGEDTKPTPVSLRTPPLNAFSIMPLQASPPEPAATNTARAPIVAPMASAPAQAWPRPKAPEKTLAPLTASAVAATNSPAPATNIVATTPSPSLTPSEQKMVLRMYIKDIRKRRDEGDSIFDEMISADSDTQVEIVKEKIEDWDRRNADLIGDYWGVASRNYYASYPVSSQSFFPQNMGKYSTQPFWDRQNYLNIIRSRQAAISALAAARSEAESNLK